MSGTTDYVATSAEHRRDSALCGCGHMRGIHRSREPHQCATAGCGCQEFRIRAASAPPAPPRVVPGRELLPGAAPAEPAVTRFAHHLRARMRALGWELADLEKHAEITTRLASFAVNGTRCDLPVAEKIARAVGRDLVTMLGPYRCGTCDGEPPAGFRCLECGTEARAA